jgi:predicted enzyme related to lactoylglutathione lyase
MGMYMATRKSDVGKITWIDLTVPNADKIKEFYSKTVGWEIQPLSLGDYDDYVMLSPSNKENVSGICHKRGGNSKFPSQWLIYIAVANLVKSVSTCKKLGGKIIVKPKTYADMGKYCVIQDPAGAVCALFEAKTKK